jgi:hypothetical protein
MWVANGVAINEDPIGVNHSLDIKYAGLLRNSGASDVLLHCGIDGWKETQDVWMQRQKDGTFTAQVKAAAAHEVNFCFKDTANNWDNNNGWNWKVGVV